MVPRWEGYGEPGLFSESLVEQETWYSCGEKKTLAWFSPRGQCCSIASEGLVRCLPCSLENCFFFTTAFFFLFRGLILALPDNKGLGYKEFGQPSPYSVSLEVGGGIISLSEGPGFLRLYQYSQSPCLCFFSEMRVQFQEQVPGPCNAPGPWLRTAGSMQQKLSFGSDRWHWPGSSVEDWGFCKQHRVALSKDRGLLIWWMLGDFLNVFIQKLVSSF